MCELLLIGESVGQNFGDLHLQDKFWLLGKYRYWDLFGQSSFGTPSFLFIYLFIYSFNYS